MKSTQTVFVGLSGGVDSSVAALRLKRAGYNVVGVFIKVWHPDWLVCNWESERLDAMRVAAMLDIPFLTCDAEEAYKTGVADYFISEYARGRTPNPDVMCNKSVKFGAFLDFATAHGADLIATGHYAQVIKNNDHYELHRGVDTSKDQSYFLWTLTQEQLSRTILPVGDSTKSVIRAEAARAGLLTAEKRDSQGICFLGHVDIAEFLSHYISLTPGVVVNENGEIIGQHVGALVYTTGQRHGFTIKTTGAGTVPHYVIDRNIEANTVTVSTHPPVSKTGMDLTVTDYNLIGQPVTMLETIEVQTRYRQTPVSGKVSHLSESDISITLQSETDISTPGQSAVFYQGNRCLGGGIIG